MKINFEKIKTFDPKPRTVWDFFKIAEMAYERGKTNQYWDNIQCLCLTNNENWLSGYYGTSFLDLRISSVEKIDPKFKPRIFISHRGTDQTIHDILINDTQIIRQKIPYQFEDAVELTENTLGIMRDYSCEIIHIGHSLGGALAQMCAHKFNQMSKTFENPAVGGILKKIDPKPIAEGNHVSYIMHGSFISHNYHFPSIGMENFHVGKVFPCLTNKNVFEFNPLKNIQNFHRMKNMESCINSDGNFVINPSIGKKIIDKNSF